MTRLHAVHRCPVVPNISHTTPSTAGSRSAASITRMAFPLPFYGSISISKRIYVLLATSTGAKVQHTQRQPASSKNFTKQCAKGSITG
ncbi:MAG: hypothetical protein VB778_00790 [Nitrospinaceae bacterium]